MYELQRMLEQLLAEGGFVMPPLLCCATLAWWGIGARFAILQNPSVSDSDLWQSRHNTEKKHGLISDFMQEIAQSPKTEMHQQSILVRYIDKLGTHQKLIISVVAIAPLLGLLGTVTGMIETFKGLGESSLFSQSGGVAGGIAEALITTQMGLVVAAPAILVSRALERRADILHMRMLNILTVVNTCED